VGAGTPVEERLALPAGKVADRGRPELRSQAYMFAVRRLTRDGLFRADYERALAATPSAKKTLWRWCAPGPPR